ncbi:MFS transporter [Candidatus Izemoplasma sp. B36]|uniref:MFS transporter n=1 Tax=Candidatus Izemoplasma sp. B36 TaxID=3242468 RepID=UPI003557B0FD
MRKLFSNKNYFLLFQGSLVSAIGTSLYSFAAGLYVQDLFGEDGGAIYLSLFMAVSIIIQVVMSPIAGTIADKLNKVRILYVTDFIRGILFFATLYILTLGYPKEIIIWILLGINALASLNQAFFYPASTACIPEIVGEELIQQANGANTLIQSVQTIFGVLAGMFLYEILGFETAVLINAISFMFSAVSEMFIRTKLKEKIETLEKPSFIEDIKFGFKYLVKKNGLLTMMIFSLLLNFSISPVFSVGIPYLLRTELNATTYQFGIIEIIFSVTTFASGMIIGGMKLKSLTHTVKRGISLLTGSFVFTTLIIILVTYNIIGYWIFYGLFAFANIVLGFSMIYTNVPINTGLMKAIEPNVRGRVFATIGALATGAIPVSLILAGVIIDNTNVAIMSIIFTILVTITTILLVSNKKVTRLFEDIDENTKRVDALNQEVEIA